MIACDRYFRFSSPGRLYDRFIVVTAYIYL